MSKNSKTPATIKATVEAIMRRWFASNPVGATGFDCMMPEEVAAWLGLDAELTHKAFARLAKAHEARFDATGSTGCRGWYRTVKGDVAAIES